MPEQLESTDLMPVIREELGFAWHTVRCVFYVSWWRLKHYVWSDVRLNQSAKLTTLISAVILFLDVLLFFLHREMAVWLGGLAVFVLIPATAIITLHRVEEAVSKNRESLFTKHAGEAADELLKLAKSPPEGKEDALSDFVSKLLFKIVEEFGEKINKTPNVMFPGADSKLRIVYLLPGARYDQNLSFEPGFGAAGFSYERTATVYIPAVKYAHGIVFTLLVDGADQNGNNGAANQAEATSSVAAGTARARERIKYGLKRRLYVPISPEYENYQSILSVPITSGKGKFAVLNVDSARRDAFKVGDIHLLRAYAHLIGVGISMCSIN